MKRNTRQSAIIDILSEQEISTQEELAKALKEKGFETTQATVSRDIKEMGLVKVAGRKKKFKYAAAEPKTTVSNSFANIFKESVLSIDYSLNSIVLRTCEGSANGAAYFLDSLHLSEILGTISGDDTILIICKRVEDVPDVIATLKEYLR